MILIVGGRSQGKAAFARSLFAEREGGSTDNRGFEADGIADPWRQALEKPCLLNFHGFIKQVMEDGQNPETFTAEVLGRFPGIITMDEVGSGIVPMEKEQRDYREAVGRAGQMLAAKADRVYRVMCGIPVRIK